MTFRLHAIGAAGSFLPSPAFRGHESSPFLKPDSFYQGKKMAVGSTMAKRTDECIGQCCREILLRDPFFFGVAAPDAARQRLPGRLIRPRFEGIIAEAVPGPRGRFREGTG